MRGRASPSAGIRFQELNTTAPAGRPSFCRRWKTAPATERGAVFCVKENPGRKSQRDPCRGIFLNCGCPCQGGGQISPLLLNLLASIEAYLGQGRKMAQLRALDSLRRCWSFVWEQESTLRSLSKNTIYPRSCNRCRGAASALIGLPGPCLRDEAAAGKSLAGNHKALYRTAEVRSPFHFLSSDNLRFLEPKFRQISTVSYFANNPLANRKQTTGTMTPY